MEIRKQTISTAKGKLPTRVEQPKAEPDNPGIVRDIFQKTMGVASAAFRIPTNLISGTIVGGVQGARKGASSDHEVSPVSTAVGQVALNTVQGQVNAAITGFMVGGPVGMATSMAMDAAGAGAGIYLFVKNGSAKEVGERLAKAIDSKVKPGEGAIKGALKGMGAGAVSSVKAAAVTGFREGKGSGAGLIEGLSAAKEQLGTTSAPKGSFLKSSMRSVLGVANGLLALPAGAVLPLLTSSDEKKAPGLVGRLALSSASGAAVCAAVGSLGGPVGTIVGASFGAVLGLASPAKSKRFSQNVLTAVSRMKKQSSDLGSDIANNNRNLITTAILGATAGATNAWNHTVSPRKKSALGQ